MHTLRILSLYAVLLLLLLLPYSIHASDDLGEAAANGDIEQIRTHLSSGAEIDALDRKTRRSPLMEAALNNHYDAVRYLIESGARLEVYCSEDSTALGYAAQGGDTALVQYLLSEGANINGQREGGATPLMRAAKLGSPDVLQLLIDRGANIDFLARKRLTAIHYVTLESGQGKAEKINILLRAGAKPSAYADTGYTPIMYAADWGNDDVVQALLEAGVSPDEGNVLEIAFKQANYDLVRILVDAGADLRTNPEFSAPLAYAVTHGKLDLAKYLIERGAPVSRYSSGLFGAAKNGHHDCVDLLSEHGAVLKHEPWLKIYETVLERSYVRSHVTLIRNMRLDGAQTPEEQKKILEDLNPALDLLLAAHQGRTDDALSLIETVMATEPWAVRDAFIYAQNEGRIDTARALKPLYYKAKHAVNRKPNDLKSLTRAAEENNAERLKSLLEAGADPNYGDKKEYSPMMIAIRGHHPELVELLLDNGADPDKDPGWNSRSPLSQACYVGTPEIVKLLLEAGADPNEGGDWTTPLYFSAGRGDVESIALLIGAGADVNLPYDDDQRTPLIEAAHQGHLEAVQLLIKHGADVNKADAKGVTPVVAAATNTHAEVAAILLRHGAAPPDDANQLRIQITYEDSGSPSRIKKLLANGADPNGLTKNASGHNITPLAHVLYRHYPKHDCVKLLLDAGADIKLVEGPLVKITTMEHETIELLIESGADVNQAAPDFERGARPIHVTAADGEFDLMRRLLRAGADPDLRTVESKLTLEQYVLRSNRRLGEIYQRERAQEAMKVIAQWKSKQSEQADKPEGEDE